MHLVPISNERVVVRPDGVRSHRRGKIADVEADSVVSEPGPSESKLTGGQKWMIAGLVVLQIPSSLIFYPLAAIFAITGIFVPIAMVLVGIGSLPISYAMTCKDRWQGGGVRERPTVSG